MRDLTRRQLLGKSIGAATAGAALVGGAAALPHVLGSASLASTGPAGDGPPLVVYVRPGTSGEIQLMRGDQETVVSDSHLVSRLRAAAGA